MVYGEGATQWTEDDDANVDAYLQQEGAAFEDEELNGKHKYGDLEYWEGRYNENDGKLKDPFDWLFTYADVAPLLEAFVDKSDHILMQGCGNAPFSKDMYNAGYNRQTNIDYSEVVIEQMQKLHADVQQYLNFQVGDSRSLMYPKNTFDVVIDKGVYDTLVCYKDKVKAVFDMVYESGRVLKPGGLYILFSLHDADDLLIFLEKQPSLHWVRATEYVVKCLCVAVVMLRWNTHHIVHRL
jgi:SAM-dependent methyltransferase